MLKSRARLRSRAGKAGAQPDAAGAQPDARARLRPRPRPDYRRSPRPPSSWPSGIRGVPWRVLAVIAAGGVIGALVRQGIWAVFPHYPGVFDWATLTINVTGCGLIGALMTVAAEVRRLHRLVPPFLGTGVLGGFTTFSTYIVGIQQSIDAGAPGAAAAYLGGTLVLALAAVPAGCFVARHALRRLAASGQDTAGGSDAVGGPSAGGPGVPGEAGRSPRAPQRSSLPESLPESLDPQDLEER